MLEVNQRYAATATAVFFNRIRQKRSFSSGISSACHSEQPRFVIPIVSAKKNRIWAVYRRIIRIGFLLGRVVGVVNGIALVLFVDFSVFVQLLPDVG